jgi:zinc transporter ZupT
MNNIFLAFLLTFIAGFSYAIGAFLIFFKDNREVVLKYSLSLSAGVMIYVYS